MVISNYIGLFNEDNYIKSLLSHGIEMISIYLVLRRDSISMENISVTINYCRNYRSIFQEKGYEVHYPTATYMDMGH